MKVFKTKGVSTFHGQNHRSITGDIAIRNIVNINNVVQRDFTEHCNPDETAYVCEQGKGQYILLKDPAKFIPDIVAVKARTMTVSVLPGITPKLENVVKVLGSTLPPTPLLHSLADSSAIIQYSEDSLEYMNKSYSSQLGGNPKAATVLNFAMGSDAISTRTIRNHSPAAKPKTAEEHWDGWVVKNGGPSYKRVLKLCSKYQRKKFPIAIMKSIEDCASGTFFDDVRTWAMKRLQG